MLLSDLSLRRLASDCAIVYHNLSIYTLRPGPTNQQPLLSAVDNDPSPIIISTYNSSPCSVQREQYIVETELEQKSPSSIFVQCDTLYLSDATTSKASSNWVKILKLGVDQIQASCTYKPVALIVPTFSASDLCKVISSAVFMATNSSSLMILILDNSDSLYSQTRASAAFQEIMSSHCAILLKSSHSRGSNLNYYHLLLRSL
ncbi:hypothetical protein FF38_05766 [Lucilia cuprina]|uniref:Uncharacterized protein n=1 Tax=Lucilia cuprina TaxID=7375 RepID=A0A0L0CAT4_LUCCU|nr:hypothetical protein FF38_05766 [Lucilia cuprina]